MKEQSDFFSYQNLVLGITLLHVVVPEVRTFSTKYVGNWLKKHQKDFDVLNGLEYTT